MSCCKIFQLRDSICHLTTNGIIYHHGTLGILFHQLHDTLETIQTFGCLRKQYYRTRKINIFQIFLLLDNQSLIIRLCYQPVHLGMSSFSINHDLPPVPSHFLVRLSYFLLQIQYHRTRGINHLNSILLCQLIRTRWFTMSPEQHPTCLQPGELIMIYRTQSQSF